MSLSNNDILRRFRYALNINDGQLSQAFSLAGQAQTATTIAALLKHEGDAEFVECSDQQLAAFLDGFIIQKRGPRPDAPPSPVNRMNNNDILKKIRVALQLRDDDLVAIMARSATPVGASEISALFRQKNHPKFKLCGDQFLRNFLTGLETWRPGNS